MRKLSGVDRLEDTCIMGILLIQIIATAALLVGHLTVVVWNRLLRER